jgi:hypothetical protein
VSFLQSHQVLLLIPSRQPNTGKYPEGPPTDWDSVDTSFAKNIASSHDQQMRFFVKFCNMVLTPTDDVVPREGLTFNGGPSAPSSPVSATASLNYSSPIRSSVQNSRSSLVPMVSTSSFESRASAKNSSPTRSSIRSSGSSLIQVACRSFFESSGSLSIQGNRSNTSVVSLSSATTVSIEELPYSCTDCDLRFRTPGQRR